MHLKYKIVEVWPNDHTIVVRYYSDTISELELMSAPGLREDGTPIRCRTDVSLSIPVPEPSEEELKKIILFNCPIGFFETQEKIKDPTVNTAMSVSTSLLNVEKTTTIEEINALRTPPVVQEQALTDTEIEQLIQNL